MADDTKRKSYDGLFGEGAKRLKGITSKKDGITRDAFIYLQGKNKDFAQCSSCSALLPDKTCAIIGIKVEDGWTCSLYVPGKYDGQKPAKRVTPEEAGLLKTQVRCENCRYADDGHCDLFEHLNEQMPEDFDLDIKISPLGCCNAFKAD